MSGASSARVVGWGSDAVFVSRISVACAFAPHATVATVDCRSGLRFTLDGCRWSQNVIKNYYCWNKVMLCYSDTEHRD